MGTINKYNNTVMSETKDPKTGKSQADLYNDSTKVLESARAMLADIQKNGITSSQTQTQTQTGGETGGGNAKLVYDFGNGTLDPVLTKLKQEAGITATQTIDEDAIRRATLKMFQKEIDSTNNIYDSMVSRQRFDNANSEGSLRAIQNRQGLVGSEMGGAQTQDVLTQGKEAIGTINSERSVKISNIQGLARKEALDRITEKRLAKQEGASNYLKYVEMEDEIRGKSVAKVVNAMISQGIDPSEMSPTELAETAKNLGVQTNDIIDLYTTSNADNKAKEVASSREGAIMGLIKDGVTDPKEIYDMVNYDENGKKIGDISISEITAITKGLKESAKDNGLTLSEGQTRYELQADGSYKVVARAPKTYAPSSSSSTTKDPYVVKFDNKDSAKLISKSMTASEVRKFEEALNEYGWEEVKDGLTKEQQAVALQILEDKGVTEKKEEEEAVTFLTADYLKGMFNSKDLEAKAKEAGFVSGGEDWIPFNEGADVDGYLESIMKIVEQKRIAGYTDKEILSSFPTAK